MDATLIPGSPIPAGTSVVYDRTYINKTRSGHFRIFLKLNRVSVATSSAAYATLEWASKAASALGVSRESFDPATGQVRFDSAPRTLVADGTTWNVPIDNRPAPLPVAAPAGLTQPVT